jgi:cytochrome c oxidase assembly protein subunit 15
MYVWLSLVSQILIVVTGGVVRLTGSGLGCPTWPKCTQDSLVTVKAMGLHGIIEFTNRLLTFALLVIAVLTLVTVLKNKQLSSRLGLRAPAIILFLGIPAQAILGGFTVLFKLNPWLVGAHFLLSAVMIATASLLVFRYYNPDHIAVPLAALNISSPLLLVGWLAVIAGVLVTGAGPHAGDAKTPRNGLNLEVWQHYHSYPAYLTLALAVWQFVVYSRRDGGTQKTLQRRTSGYLVYALVYQAIIGVAQARFGVPAILVGLHMVGATVILSLLSFQWLLVRGKTR